MRLFGGVLMVDRDVVESYAKQLCLLWAENMLANGAVAFRAVEEKKAALMAKADELGIRNEVYARANHIMNPGDD